MRYPIVGLLLTFCLLACQTNKKQYYQQEGEVFHTIFSVKYESSKSQAHTIEEALQAIDRSANPFNKASLLYAVNNNRPQWQDTTLSHIIEKALAICELTQGRYDITVGPLVNLWGFGYEKSSYQGDVPASAIDSIRAFVGYQRIHLQGDSIYKEDPRISIDLASVAKGYACDLVGERLRLDGVDNYLVDIGGEIAFCGVNPDGKPWRLGINKPLPDTLGIHNGELEVYLELPSKGGVATSGNYRNFKTSTSGRVYAHTIDPTKGAPIQSEVLSATILAKDCATADALATASMVIGGEQTIAMIEKLPDVEAALIVSDSTAKGYHLITTEGMKQYIKKDL